MAAAKKSNIELNIMKAAVSNKNKTGDGSRSISR